MRAVLCIDLTFIRSAGVTGCVVSMRKGSNRRTAVTILFEITGRISTNCAMQFKVAVMSNGSLYNV